VSGRRLQTDIQSVKLPRSGLVGRGFPYTYYVCGLGKIGMHYQYKDQNGSGLVVSLRYGLGRSLYIEVGTKIPLWMHLLA